MELMEVTSVNAVQNGYKKTEVGIIPIDWEMRRFEEIANISMGQSPAGSSYNQNEKGIALINGPTEFTAKYPLKKQWTTQPTKLCKDGDILLCVRGSSTGRMNISNDEYCIGRGVAALSSKPKYDKLLLEYLTYNVIDKILSLTSGSTFPNIDGKSIRSIQIAIPATLTEQTAIAMALSDADALISSLEQLIAKKKNIKQGAMQELLRPKEGWVERKLGEVVEIKKGQLITESTRINGSFPVIAGGKTPAYYHNKPNRNGKTITISGSGASAGYVNFHNSPIFASDCSTISEAETYSIEYIYYYLQLIQEKIYIMQTGGAQPHIHPSDLFPVRIPFPKVDIQEKVSNIFSTMDNEIKLLQIKLEKIKKVKQGMMQDLLTGRVRLI